MNELQERIDKVLRIADKTGQQDASEMPTDPVAAALVVDIATIAAVLRGQWDVIFHKNSDDYEILDLTHPKQTN